MAFRIDNDGNRIDSLGRIIATSEADRAHFRALMQASWKENHGREPIPENQTVMVTENGDCQWTIAEDAGADPVKTYTQLNDQFTDPNLIHPGDVVFVDTTTRYGGEVAPDGTSSTNVGLFGDRIYSETSQVSTGDGPNYTQQFDGVKGNVLSYLDTIPGSQWNPVVEDLIVNYDWSTGDEGSYGRKLVIDAYFERLDAEGTAQQGYNRLMGLAEGIQDPRTKLAVQGDIQASYNALSA